MQIIFTLLMSLISLCFVRKTNLKNSFLFFPERVSTQILIRYSFSHYEKSRFYQLKQYFKNSKAVVPSGWKVNAQKTEKVVENGVIFKICMHTIINFLYNRFESVEKSFPSRFSYINPRFSQKLQILIFSPNSQNCAAEFLNFVWIY